MARKTNFNYEKRQKELRKQKKRQEKLEAKRARREARKESDGVVVEGSAQETVGTDDEAAAVGPPEE